MTVQHLGKSMSDIHWHSIEIESNDENQEIGHSLDATASELHSHFISKTKLLQYFAEDKNYERLKKILTNTIQID